MTWLRKAKEWVVSKVTSLFRKEVAESPEVEVAVAVVEKKAGALENVARRALALGPAELTESKTILSFKTVCIHDYFVMRQKWVKIAAKQFELKNEMCCSNCKETTITSID